MKSYETKVPFEGKVILEPRCIRANLCEYILIQVKKKVLESGSQLSDASIKMSTRILLNGFSKESRGWIGTIELSTCSESWWIVNFCFRSSHVEIRFLTRLYNRVRKTTISSSIARISFLIYILCKVKYMNYVYWVWCIYIHVFRCNNKIYYYILFAVIT